MEPYLPCNPYIASKDYHLFRALKQHMRERKFDGYNSPKVFKFADKPAVWFFCQIQMCMKKSGMCDGITPPACATTAPPIVEPEEGYPLSPRPVYPPSLPPLDEFAYPEPTPPLPSPPRVTTSSYEYIGNKRHSEYIESKEEVKDLKPQ
ncbi:hypothetical protein KIN20_014925, partial [Parelaphostrongylus tenuis]